jgi:triosephosphate isomerase (TIM)
MRKKIIAGNWKMNGTVDETRELLASLLIASPTFGKAIVVVCPPYTSISAAREVLDESSIELGAQDMSQHLSGAYTGEVSGPMLLTAGVSWVILGHSERRQYHAETDELVNLKLKTALQLQLNPIVCVGETLEQRQAGQTEEIVGSQVVTCLRGISASDLSRVVIAYEPVWAIGTGKTATPEMAQDVHAFIRGRVSEIDASVATMVPILYGGSVKADNAEGLLAKPDIDGALVGGASLKVNEFLSIVNAVK